MHWSSCGTICFITGALLVFLIADIHVSLTPQGRCETPICFPHTLQEFGLHFCQQSFPESESLIVLLLCSLQVSCSNTSTEGACR